VLGPVLGHAVDQVHGGDHTPAPETHSRDHAPDGSVRADQTAAGGAS
jgi:hypothetical protein